MNLKTLLFFSAQERGIHRNEIAQKLKISQEKIMYIYASLLLSLSSNKFLVYSCFILNSEALSLSLPLQINSYLLLCFILNSEAMESLESEGLVYSTIDEFHYKSTAS